MRRSCDTLSRNARSWPRALCSSSPIVLMASASSPSSSCGMFVTSTRAEKSPLAIRPAVVSMAAIGRVIRRARTAATTAATTIAPSAARSTSPLDDPNGRFSTSFAMTTTGVRPRTGASGVATNTVLPSRPVCVSPFRSAVVSRSAGDTPGGSLMSELSVPKTRLRISCWLPLASRAMTAPSDTVSVLSMRRLTRGARFVPARRSRSCASVNLSAPLNTSVSAPATSGAFCWSSWRAASDAVRRARLAVIPAVTTSTPSAMASIATVSRVRSLRRGRLTSRRRASTTPGGIRRPAPS